MDKLCAAIIFVFGCSVFTFVLDAGLIAFAIGLLAITDVGMILAIM
jgi:hypothetical protein